MGLISWGRWWQLHISILTLENTMDREKPGDSTVHRVFRDAQGIFLQIKMMTSGWALKIIQQGVCQLGRGYEVKPHWPWVDNCLKLGDGHWQEVPESRFCFPSKPQYRAQTEGVSGTRSHCFKSRFYHSHYLFDLEKVSKFSVAHFFFFNKIGITLACFLCYRMKIGGWGTQSALNGAWFRYSSYNYYCSHYYRGSHVRRLLSPSLISEDQITPLTGNFIFYKNWQRNSK